ncbi:sialin-like isoform X2 [Leptidea sinapis]|nr:sialin-like isoform X2 [Leptidea sinapis]
MFTFITPVVIRIGGSTWLFILRVLQGMGEGPTVPGMMIMMSRWTPPHQRAIQSALIFGGALLGNVFGAFISGVIMSGGRDWAYVFYFFGVFGVIWFILWTFLCYSEPNDHPFITKEELEYLSKTVTRAEITSKKDPVPWKAIFRSPAAWALICAGIGHDWGFYTMVTDLPKYMHDVLKFDIATTGSLSSLPFIAKWVAGFIFGFSCDYGIKKKWYSVRNGRILYTTIGSTFPAILLVCASYAGCNRNAATTYFILAMGCMGGYNSGMKVNTLDVAPNYAGSVTAIINTVTTFAGIISPHLIGLLTPDSTLIQWRTAFWVTFVVMVGSNIGYAILADGKQQWWDDVRQFGYPPSWKHGPIIKDDVPHKSLTVVLISDNEETIKVEADKNETPVTK